MDKKEKGLRLGRSLNYRIPPIAIVVGLAVMGIGVLIAYLLDSVTQLPEDVVGGIVAVFVLLGIFLLYGCLLYTSPSPRDS